ncbi:MAG: hypothetical protein ACNI3A_01960 [Desulfovibrio sp.]|uniref:hypothetical protein n=1 Tax=Desulfovibrio sp. 7SRBS1 TaxID=3378064 RepID=UPI003B3F2158
MGKILQIRVTAQTFKTEDVEKVWPKLYATAWPDAPRGVRQPGGVPELVDELEDQFRFGDIPADVKAELEKAIPALMECKTKMQDALADWDPATADTLSYQLEDLLSELESDMPKV